MKRSAFFVLLLQAAVLPVWADAQSDESRWTIREDYQNGNQCDFVIVEELPNEVEATHVEVIAPERQMRHRPAHNGSMKKRRMQNTDVEASEPVKRRRQRVHVEPKQDQVVQVPTDEEMVHIAVCDPYEDWSDCIPYYRPGYRRCGTILAHADYLYWRPCNESFFIALDAPGRIKGGGIPVIPENISFIAETETCAKVIHPSFQGCSGFRLGLGIQFSECCWDWVVKWTYLNPDTSHSVHRKEPTLIPFTGLDLDKDLSTVVILVTLQAPPSTIETDQSNLATLRATDVKGKWELCLNVVDFQWGQQLCLTSCFSLHPHIGLRYASIDQILHVKSDVVAIVPLAFDQNVLSFENPSEVYKALLTEHFKNDFCGVGPNIGLEARWNLGCGFGLFGSLGTSFLYGNRETSDRGCADDRVFSLPSPLSITQTVEGPFFAKRKSDSDCTRSITDTELGIDWQTSFCCDRIGLTLKLGWEHHYFFKQGILDHPIMGKTLDHYPDGDLSLQGLTVSAGLSF